MLVYVNVRGCGIGTCSTWIPSHGVSSGKSVNVPLAASRTLLHPESHPWYSFCQAFMCRQPLPIGS